MKKYTIERMSGIADTANVESELMTNGNDIILGVMKDNIGKVIAEYSDIESARKDLASRKCSACNYKTQCGWELEATIFYLNTIEDGCEIGDYEFAHWE